MNRTEKNELIMLFSPRIFWDVKIETLDFWHNRDYIIERAVVYGTENDEKLLYKLYSWREIKKNVIKSDSLNDTVIHYLSAILGVKKEKFKCYGRIPLHMNC